MRPWLTEMCCRRPSRRAQARRAAQSVHNKRGNLPRQALPPLYRRSTRLPELEDEAVGAAADLRVEHHQVMLVGGVAEQVAAPGEAEARPFEIGPDHIRIDAV